MRLLPVALATILPVAAQADLIYNSTFESGVIDPGWSTNAHLDQGTAFSRFMGRYSENTPTVLNNSVSLTIPRPTDDGTTGMPFTLLFDFYCLDNWHGNDPSSGPDRFEVFINSVNMFSYTFSNTSATQTFRAPDVGPAFLGFVSSYRDSIYRDIQIDFDPGTAPNIIFKWRSDGLTSVASESWGIDNVRIMHNIPTPGSLALLGLSGLVAVRRRRR